MCRGFFLGFAKNACARNAPYDRPRIEPRIRMISSDICGVPRNMEAKVRTMPTINEPTPQAPSHTGSNTMRTRIFCAFVSVFISDDLIIPEQFKVILRTYRAIPDCSRQSLASSLARECYR